MTSSPKLTMFHAPQTRSTGTMILLDELGASYDLHLLNMKAGEQRQPAFLAVNPMGKVPAILHGEGLVIEQPAIFLYLADLFPEAGLAPAIGDPLRGPYVSWMVYYGSCFEPALMDRSQNREPSSVSMSGYGSYDAVIDRIASQLRKGPYMLGDRFSALDILWGVALGWTLAFKIVPELPEFVDYAARINGRPSVARVKARDAAWAEEHARAVAAAG